MRHLPTSVLAILLTGCLLGACHKDNSTIAPSFGFKGLKEDAILWNTATFELALPDPSSIVSAALYAGNNLVATSGKAPFTLEWNTLSVADGPYELRAVVTDRNGGQQESKSTIVVQNGLLKFTVQPDHLTSPDGTLDRGWIFLSDQDGAVIAFTEMTNGAEIKLSNPAFNKGTFMLSEAYLRDAGTTLDITSFVEVPRGNWSPAAINKGPDVIGKLDWHFKDSLNFHPFFASSSGDSQLFIEGGTFVQLQLTNSPSRLFIREVGQDINHYKLLTGLTASQQYVGLFTDMNKSFSIQTYKAPTGTNRVGVRLYGFLAPNKFDEFYILGAFTQYLGQVLIEYPGTDFPIYGSENLCNANGYRINSFHPTQMIDVSPLKAEVQFKDLSNNKASLATFGDFDVYVMGWGYATKFTSFSWSVLGGPGRSEVVKLPDFPQLLRQVGYETFDPSKLGFAGVVQVADYEIANDYAGYLRYISQNGFNSPYAMGKRWKEQTFSASGYTNGRTIDLDNIPTIKDRLTGRK
jgi:hypothetical protein